MSGAKEFERLAAVAKLVLVLPHANADAERVFSVVGLNKTKRRDSLALDGIVINNDHKDGQSGALLQMGAPLRYHQDPRRPQASITMPTDHRQGLYPASDTDYASFLVIFVMHSSVLLLEKGVLFKHFICCTFLFLMDHVVGG